MLTSSFIHLRGVGPITERKLWDSGVTSWGAFLESAQTASLGPKRTRSLEAGVNSSIDHLRTRDHRFFRRWLPTREAWRAYAEFRDSIAYVDIETTGMESEADEITIIGLYDGERFHSYVGPETTNFPDDLERFSVIVTFNGASFDLPFLRRALPDLRLHQIHIDLRHVFARLGMKGGLKSVEKRLGIARTPRTKDLRGMDAVYLWNKYTKGDEEALEILLEYNMEDVVNLKELMGMAYQRLKAECLHHGFRTYSLRDLPEVPTGPTAAIGNHL